MNELPETVKAYLAGLIDGEGCIHIARSKKKAENAWGYRLELIINMTDGNLIEWCQEVTGVGRIQHYGLSSTTHNKMDEYHWIVNQSNTVSLLREILPYLRLKRSQAEAALDYAKLIPTGRPRITPELEAKREKFYWLLRELKRSPCGAKQTRFIESKPGSEVIHARHKQ